MVNLCNDFIWVFVRQDKRLPIDRDSLSDNVGERENDENTTQAPL